MMADRIAAIRAENTSMHRRILAVAEHAEITKSIDEARYVVKLVALFSRGKNTSQPVHCVVLGSSQTFLVLIIR